MSNQMTPVGVPAELVFDLPSSMLDSRKIEQRIQPYSQSTYNQAGQVAKFTIPQTDRMLLNGQTMYLTGQLDISGLTAPNGTSNIFDLLGTYYSLFSRQVVNANGTVLETIERPGELVNMLLNMTMDSGQRLAQQNSIGTSAVGNVLGLTFNNLNTALSNVGNTGNGLTQTFSIPIIGIFDAMKYMPMWNSNIDLELTLNNISNILVAVGSANTAGSVPVMTLSNLELVFDTIELSPESFTMVTANYPQKVVIKTQTYLSGTGSIQTGASGGQDIPINARLSSLKQLYFYFNQSGLADGTFGGLNPNGQDVVFITNGKYYPQRPIKLTNPSEVYMQQRKSFGSVKSVFNSGSSLKRNFARRQTGNRLYNDPILAANAQSLVSTTSGPVANQFYLAVDTEIINTNKASLYNGIQTGVNSNIRLNIANDLTATMTCYYWCCYDALLEFDFMTGITRAIY
jgi:hypothetical protein